MGCPFFLAIQAMSVFNIRLGPLTTTFTPAPHCFSNLFDSSGGINTYFQAQTYSKTSTIVDDPACWPTPVNQPVSASPPTSLLPLEGRGYYSPGLVCPASFTSACSLTGVYTGPTSPASSYLVTATSQTRPSKADFSFLYPLLPPGDCGRLLSNVCSIYEVFPPHSAQNMLL